MTLLIHLLLSLVPLAGGFCLVCLLHRQRGESRGLGEVLALSYLLGLSFLALSAWLIGRAGLPVTFSSLFLVQLLPGVLFALPPARRAGVALVRWQNPLKVFSDRRWWEWALLVLIVSKLIYVITMDLNGLLRANDAFKGALAFAKFTFFEGTYLGFAERFEVAEGYPLFPGFILLWFGMGRAAWNEFGVNLAHLNYFVAFLLLFYAALRDCAGRKMGLVGVYVLSAMPLLLVHVVLVGYADLPMTIYLTATGLYTYRYARTGKGSDLALAVCFLAFLPFVKVEGLVPYFMIGAYVLGGAVLYRRGRVGPAAIWGAAACLVTAALLSLLALAARYGLQGPPALAGFWVNIMPGNNLAEVGEPLAKHFLHYFNNWMLLGTLVALAFPFLVLGFSRGPAFVPALFGSLLLGAFAYLYIVGGAHLWLITGTVVNRSFMQIFPSLLFGAMVLLRPVIPGEPRQGGVSPGTGIGARARMPAGEA